MIRTVISALIAALLATAALAATGTPPGTGPQLIDGQWLQGLANGQNQSYQSGITAAGTTQVTATPLPAGIYLLEVDTVPASSGVTLPFCLAGSELSVYNSTATTLKYYPNVLNNPVTGAQDTINAGTVLTVTSAAGGTVSYFSCAKNGVWAAK